ncbi:MAG: hypothetical protein M3256_10900, partial [Actinomycetota bacterium]|nr:hypothetical protein [Actinomycetota bacterium]
MVEDQSHSEMGERRSAVELDELARAVSKLGLEQQLSPQQINERLQKEGLRTRGARDVALLTKRALDRHRPLVTVHVESVGDVPFINDSVSTDLAEITGIPRVIAVKTTLPEGEESWNPELLTRGGNRYGVW